MRKLKMPDLFSACRSLKALGIKEDLEKASKDADSARDVWEHGYDLVWNVIDRATETNGERMIYEFLAGPFEMTVEQIEDLDLPVFLDLVKQLAEENDLIGFFKRAGALTK